MRRPATEKTGNAEAATAEPFAVPPAKPALATCGLFQFLSTYGGK